MPEILDVGAGIAGAFAQLLEIELAREMHVREVDGHGVDADVARLLL
jgi:hypothetical protein